MQHHEHARPDRHHPPPPARTVWDAAAGREWRVWATDCRDVPGARGAECLIFDCGTTVRRLWSPPSDWAALSDADLLALVNTRVDR